jgi:hypothetical protein
MPLRKSAGNGRLPLPAISSLWQAAPALGPAGSPDSRSVGPATLEPQPSQAVAQGHVTTRERPMAATHKSSSSHKTRRTRRTGRRDPLAVRLLKKDHREVEGWFDEYEQLEDEQEKLELFNRIALALKVHTRIEEEIMYPAERGEVEDDLLDEAYVEHDSAKKLIAEIEAMKPSDEFYDAKVKVLGEYIKHHVKEEEQPGGFFAQAKRGDEDLDAMGERLKARKEELMAEMGGGKPS